MFAPQRIRRIPALLCCLPCAASCWTFENRAYYNPLIAEPRAAVVNLLAAGLSDEFPFSLEPGRRRVWDISLGKEIPLVGFDYSGWDGKDNPPQRGEWGWGVWLPVSFHMVEDFKDPSFPILNTDYRFNGMVKAQWGLSRPESGNDSRVGVRFQVGHESTHLGDEFSLNARNRHPDFLRVNVSYEHWEYGVSFETDPGDHHKLAFRHGGIGLLRPGAGFYSDTLLETPDRNRTTIFRSVNNFEPSFGFQWMYDRKLFAGFGPFASLDVRHKAIYDYFKANASIREDKQFSFNLLVGIRLAERAYISRFSPNIYVRLYHGVNPHGQFRSRRDYSLVGVGLFFPM